MHNYTFTLTYNTEADTLEEADVLAREWIADIGPVADLHVVEDGELSPAPDTVYSLSIESRHGLDLYVYATHKAASDALVAYVRENWADESKRANWEGSTEAPEADREAVLQYFTNISDEYYELTAQPVRLK